MTPETLVKVISPEVNDLIGKMRSLWDLYGEVLMVRAADGSVTLSPLAEALAAERHATVESIRHAVLFQRTRLGTPPEKMRVTDLLAILDEEGAR